MQKKYGRAKRSIALIGAALMVSGGFVAGATAANAAEGAVVTVCPAGACDFDTLQGAIDAADPGDTIQVAAGTYGVNVRIDIDKPLTIAGPNAEIDPVAAPGSWLSEAVIESDGDLTNGYAFHIAEGVDGVKIAGLTFADSGIVASPSTKNVTITNNQFLKSGYTSPVIQSYAGVGAQNWKITSNVITPGASGTNSGINLADTDNVVIAGNAISDTGHSGMNLSNLHDAEVSSNTVSNTLKQGINLSGLTGTTSITDNTLTSAGTVDEAARGAVRVAGAATAGNFVITGNTIRDSSRGINLNSDVTSTESTFAVHENTFEKNAVADVLNLTTGTLQVDATLNWWGTETPVFKNAIVGNVIVDPYYTNAERTSRSDTETTEVSLIAPKTMLPGEALRAQVSLVPSSAPGKLELFKDGVLMASSATSSGALSVDLAGLTVGTYSLQGKFTSADTLAFSSSESAVVELAVSKTAPPAPAPDSDALDKLIEEKGLDPAGTAKTFVSTSPDGTNDDVSDLDPTESLVGELPWTADDAFVNVYAYSTPIFLGAFPVVDRMVQLDADISALAAGTHQLVFVGQTSGVVQVMTITVQGEVAPGGEGEAGGEGAVVSTGGAGGASLPATGAEPTSPLIIGAALAAMLLGGILVAVGAKRRRALAVVTSSDS